MRLEETTQPTALGTRDKGLENRTDTQAEDDKSVFQVQ